MEANKTTEQLEHVGWEIVQDVESGRIRAAAERLCKTDRMPSHSAWLSAFVMSTLAEGGQVALLDAISETLSGDAHDGLVKTLRVVRKLIDGSQPKDLPGAIMVIDAALSKAQGA